MNNNHERQPEKPTTLWALLRAFKIEIPLIQRGYAQGRERASAIRKDFLDNLFAVLSATGETAPLELDFVYGKVLGKRLQLLDGQQRLTTLYLLHWFLALRERRLAEVVERLRNFSYEVRTSSREFCAFLCSPELCNDFANRPLSEQSIAFFIKNRPEYIPAWERDSSIQGMLTMLDEIKELFGKVPENLSPSPFDRLTNPERPYIVFSFLPLNEGQFDLSDNLYITMNARGKQLTDFELFKSQFLDFLEKEFGKDRRDDMAKGLDGDWTRFFWDAVNIEIGRDKKIENARAATMDLAFQRYIDHISLILGVWDSDDGGVGHQRKTSVAKTPYAEMRDKNSLDRAKIVFSRSRGENKNNNPLFSGDDGNLEFLQQSLTRLRVMQKKKEYGSIDKFFTAICPPLFFTQQGKDPLTQCCFYQSSYKQELMLFAVCIAIMHDPELSQNECRQRLRIARNLLHNSDDAITPDNMPRLAHDIFRVVHRDELDTDMSFNKSQIKEEMDKKNLRSANSNLASLREKLEDLEDHDLLQGRLALFADEVGNLEPVTLVKRGETFLRLFSGEVMNDYKSLVRIERALLAMGDYKQQIRWYDWDRRYQLATGDKKVWYELFTSSQRSSFIATRNIIQRLLDELGLVEVNLLAKADKLVDDWLKTQENNDEYSWRYYFIKYPEMRDGQSGIYLFSNDDGFNIYMLDRTRLSSYYRDPYLWTIFCRVLGENMRQAQDDLSISGLWSFGYEKSPVRIKETGDLRCVDNGWELKPLPGNPSKYEEVRQKFNIDPDSLLRIEKAEKADKVDRIIVGMDLIKELMKACPPSSD